MKFIMLTTLAGNKTIINTDYIIQVGFDDGVNMGKGATIVCINPNAVTKEIQISVHVKEKVEEVYKRINDIIEIQNKPLS